MLVIWGVLVIYPFFYRDLGYRKETISALGQKKKNVFIAITTALLIGNFFQVVFLTYLQNKYAVNTTSYGFILYLTMCLTSFLATIFVPKYNPKIHFISSACYFVVVPLMMPAIGYEIIPYGNLIFNISIVLSFLYVFVSLFFLKRYKETNAMIEIFCFLILSVWTLFLTFY